MADHVATAETDIDAPVGRAWAALTDPEQIKRYTFGSQVTTDWTQGSPITWAGDYQGKTYEDKGEIVEIEPERRLKVTAESLGLDRQYGLARQWLAVQDDHPDWRDAAFSSDTWLKLTAGKLVALRGELRDLLDRYHRYANDDPEAERRDVFLLARGFPARP